MSYVAFRLLLSKLIKKVENDEFAKLNPTQYTAHCPAASGRQTGQKFIWKTILWTVAELYLPLTFISSQTQGNKWSRSKLTNPSVFLWKCSPVNLKLWTRYMSTFHYFHSRLVKLIWTNPLYLLLWGNTFFSKCWETFGRSVCCSCTLEPHKVSLKVRGLPDWAAESDRWPQNTDGTKPALSSRWYAESGASVLDCDMPQHSLAVLALKPEQIKTSSYVNNLDRAGKTHAQTATKEGHRNV